MSESNVKIQKIQKNSNVALCLITVTKILLIACAVISFSTGCWCIGAKDYVDREWAKAGVFTKEELSMAIQIDGGLLSGMIDLKSVDSVAVTVGVTLLIAAVMMICFTVVLHFVAKVFKVLKESDSPFRPEIVKSLKIAFVLTALLVLQSSLLIGAIVALSLWCIFLIFEYGCELQQQSDETL